MLTRLRLENGIVASGVNSVLGAGSLFTTGKVFYVDSNNGSNDNSGEESDAPKATLASAITAARATKGDVIILAPGHAETVTSSNITLSKAGVTIIGLGNGTTRPTFTYGAAAATITVSAADVEMYNCRFVANFADVAAAFTVGAAKQFTVADSEFLDNASNLNFLTCVVTGATANAADGLTFVRNYVYSLPTTDGAVVSVLGDLLRLNVSNNMVDKAATNDAGHLITMSSKVCGGVRILNNILTMRALSNQSAGTLFTGSSTTSSGICANNYVAQIDTSAGIIATTGTKISFIQNFMSGAADKSGTLIPAADDPT